MGHKSSIIIPLIALGLTALAPAVVHAGSLPPLINFQSVLLDEGGNLLPSGPTTVQFQILDENHEAIYSETQTVEVVKGAVSALIGNGADGKGVTTGGVPDDVFATGASRYLQVQVGSHAPEDPMTIVPVPYAQWSETCASVADGAVAAGKIAKAAVGFEHLAPDVVAKLADEMSRSQGVVTMQSLGGSGGATQVGVEAKFINSGKSSVQGVLQDIDLSVKKRQEETTFLTGKLNEEVTNRTNAVAQEIADRTTAVTNVQNQITQEVSDRVFAIGQEVTARSTADAAFSQTLSDINNIPGTLSFDKVQTSTPPPSDLNMGGHIITNLGGPVAQSDATTKSYVDGAIAASQSQSDLSLSEAVAQQAKIATGTYVGNGNNPKTVTQIGFKPRVLYISGNNAAPFNVFSTTYLGVDQNGDDMTSTTGFNNSGGITGNNIIQINADGFDIASGDPNWNQDGMVYSYTAIGQ